MRVLQLPPSGTVYTSNAWLVLGDWSRLEDVNGLVDVGRDPGVLRAILQAPTGVGKRKIERVVLTHSHYDHAELLPRIRAAFDPEVCAGVGTGAEVDRLLREGDRILLGDEEFEVIAAHSHTADSICLFSPASGALFHGDAPILIHAAGGTYEPGFLNMLTNLCRRDIRVFYPGHGDPITEGCNARLRASLEVVRNSVRQDLTESKENSR
jgi:glyoxylase-like metal-dependent hydrolase (beta-lactamase superfamily II)